MDIKNTIPVSKYTWNDYIENISKIFQSEEVFGKRNIKFEIKVK